MFCAEPQPLDPATLCRRLVGHAGLHCPDGSTPRPDLTDTEEHT